MPHTKRLPALLALPLLLNGCVAGWVVGETVDVAIEVAKVPFKVGGAAVDLAIPDDDAPDDAD